MGGRAGADAGTGAGAAALKFILGGGICEAAGPNKAELTKSVVS